MLYHQPTNDDPIDAVPVCGCKDCARCDGQSGWYVRNEPFPGEVFVPCPDCDETGKDTQDCYFHAAVTEAK